MELATEKADIAKPDGATSDARWLEAVRTALVDHAMRDNGAPAAPVIQPVLAVPVAGPAAPTVEASPAAVSLAPASQPVPAAANVAPALPSPANIAPPPEPRAANAEPVRQAKPDHPVPPAAIPDAPVSLQPTDVKADAKPASDSDRSRLGQLISEIPLVNRIVEPAR